MLFSNLKIFRLSPEFDLTTGQIEAAVSKQAFRPCSSQDPFSIGWGEVQGQPLLNVGQQVLLSVKSEKKLLPTSVINHFAQEKAEEIEETQGYKVGRKQMKEIKEDLIVDLMPKAFSVFKEILVWFDLENKWVGVATPSAAQSDEVMGLIAKTFDPFPVLPIYTDQSPSSAMMQWLLAFNAPYPFSIDQSTELKDTMGSSGVVRYANLNLDNEETRGHLAEGKHPTRLAVTWDDSIMFDLTDGMDLKKIKCTDYFAESNAPGDEDNQEDIFQSMFTLTAETLNKVLVDVIDALGGEKEVD